MDFPASIRRVIILLYVALVVELLKEGATSIVCYYDYIDPR